MSLLGLLASISPSHAWCWPYHQRPTFCQTLALQPRPLPTTAASYSSESAAPAPQRHHLHRNRQTTRKYGSSSNSPHRSHLHSRNGYLGCRPRPQKNRPSSRLALHLCLMVSEQHPPRSLSHCATVPTRNTGLKYPKRTKTRFSSCCASKTPQCSAHFPTHMQHTHLASSYLSPIGKHRRAHIKPSKGKRAEKKRKRQQKESSQNADAMAVDAPAKPDIASQIDVGFNSVTSHLQSRPSNGTEDKGTPEKPSKNPYSMVFVCRGNQTAAFNTHFPQMVAAASPNADSDQATRLVGFSKPCSERLSESLGIARVSCIAIQAGASGTGTLWDLVKQSTKPVQCEWLSEARDLKYRPTQIVSVDAKVGPKKVKQVAAA